jgi:hypothetical protein
MRKEKNIVEEFFLYSEFIPIYRTSWRKRNKTSNKPSSRQVMPTLTVTEPKRSSKTSRARLTSRNKSSKKNIKS